MKFKKLIAATAISAAALANMALPALADTTTNPSTKDCLGVERQSRNTPGGDREHGGFGPVQSAFVKSEQPYGQWLKNEWKPANCQ